MRVLVENLDPDSGLVREWGSKGCINHQHCCKIEETSPRFKRNRKLLNILLKRSVADYDLFIECLKICDQEHLAQLLEIREGEYLPDWLAWFEVIRIISIKCAITGTQTL